MKEGAAAGKDQPHCSPVGFQHSKRSHGSTHHVEELLEQALGGLALAPQHLVEVGIADAFLEHLLQTPGHVGLCSGPRDELLCPQNTSQLEKKKNPNPSCAGSRPPSSPTLAEGELLMMAVSTPIAWTAMASEPTSKTCRKRGWVGCGHLPRPHRAAVLWGSPIEYLLEPTARRWLHGELVLGFTRLLRAVEVELGRGRKGQVGV